MHIDSVLFGNVHGFPQLGQLTTAEPCTQALLSYDLEWIHSSSFWFTWFRLNKFFLFFFFSCRKYSKHWRPHLYTLSIFGSLGLSEQDDWHFLEVVTWKSLSVFHELCCCLSCLSVKDVPDRASSSHGPETVVVAVSWILIDIVQHCRSWALFHFTASGSMISFASFENIASRSHSIFFTVWADLLHVS